MAKPIASRRSDALNTFKNSMTTPGLVVEPTPYFSPPRGINTLAPLSRLPKEYSPVIINLMLAEGVLKSRPGTIAVGDPSDSTLAIIPFTAADSSGALFRVTVLGMDRWNGTAWVPIPTALFGGRITDRITWAGWKNQLLLCNGVDKIFSYDVLTGIGEYLNESFPCKHLTVFNNRVIASAVLEGPFYGYRERWSVKNNEKDWTSETTEDGIGAGFEDLLGSPGGYVDQLMGVFPLTDETALMVREKSLWLQYVTGNVDAPFRFSRMTREVGTRARHGIQGTPYGVVMLSQDDVLLVNESGWTSIGEPIRRTLLPSITDIRNVSSTYDPVRQEYRLAESMSVWRYSFIDKGWTRDVYPFSVSDISAIDYRSLGLTFDELTGTMDELAGTFDELVRQFQSDAVHMVSSWSQVVKEDPSTIQDLSSDSEIEIRTGLLQSASPLDETELIEAQLEYEAEIGQRLVFEHSLDKGNSWIQYSELVAPATTGPQIVSVRRTLVSHNLQVRVRSTQLGRLTLIALYLFVVKGVRVNP